jgi:hypothetical protein
MRNNPISTRYAAISLSFEKYSTSISQYSAPLENFSAPHKKVASPTGGGREGAYKPLSPSFSSETPIYRAFQDEGLQRKVPHRSLIDLTVQPMVRAVENFWVLPH